MDKSSKKQKKPAYAGLFLGAYGAGLNPLRGGLLRRFAPRNDVLCDNTVIASDEVARRSTAEGSNKKNRRMPVLWTATSGYARLAVTGLGLAPRGGLLEVHPIHNIGIRLVTNNEFFEQATDGFDVVVVSGDAQGAQLRLQLSPGQEFFAGLEDARVRGGQRVVANEELFVALFAGAQAGDFDFNITLRAGVVLHAQAGELDHATREVEDFDGFAHVEDKDFGARWVAFCGGEVRFAVDCRVGLRPPRSDVGGRRSDVL
jgi:hypothetical protein